MSHGQGSGYLENNKMDPIQFQLQPGETILYRTTPDHKWYALAWKIAIGIAGVALLTFILYGLLGAPTQNAVLAFLPIWLASLLTKILYLLLVPLAGVAWVITDLASSYTGVFILTDRRIWVRGSPYAWDQSETALEDIASMTWRRDTIFIRRKATRGVQVHMFPEGKQIVKTYQQWTGKKN